MSINQPRYTVYCEICGKELLEDYAYSYFLSINTTGFAGVGAFSCGASRGGQHFGCTADHAAQAAILCIQNHMHPALMQKHKYMIDTGHTKASLEDKEIEKQRGENFHFTGRTYTKGS